LIAVMEKSIDRIEAEWGPLTGGLRDLMDRVSGPILRMTAYPAGVRDAVNHPHTDIDLFTVLPAPTQPGLEIEIGGRWKGVETVGDQILLLPGDLIEHFGGPSPARHRVMSNGHSRMSASLFVNANPSLKVGNTPIAEMVEERLALVRGARP
jgi:isopenicillin N synthase-like dioxygenase